MIPSPSSGTVITRLSNCDHFSFCRFTAVNTEFSTEFPVITAAVQLYSCTVLLAVQRSTFSCTAVQLYSWLQLATELHLPNTRRWMATGVVWRVCYANTETRPFITTHETFSVQMRRGRRNGRAAAESEKLSARSGRSRHSFRSHHHHHDAHSYACQTAPSTP